jgi:hypothetical protein
MLWRRKSDATEENSLAKPADLDEFLRIGFILKDLLAKSGL